MARNRSNPYAEPDQRTRAAKAAGYPARSVFKLDEINHRVRLLRQGYHVLDLGAAPGSWSKYVSEQIGQAGRLLAVDLDPLTVPLGPQGHVLEADVLQVEPSALAAFAPYDVVLSDMAPRTTGNRTTDAWRSFELFDRALSLCAMLKPDGSFVGKLFMGESFEQARANIKTRFREIKLVRPDATRSMSFEVFLVGLGARPQPKP